MEKIIETKQCINCNINFDITNIDLDYYDKLSPIFDGEKFDIPTPKLCPDCRQQRRLSFRNERKLYKRNCDATGKQIISIYSPDKSCKVYDSDFWWSDKWNATDYGIDFDFNKSFFDQFKGLLENVPKQNIIGTNNVNSGFCNLAADNKNCYLISESSNNEECYYGYWLQKCRYCMDSGFMHECEYCYESENCFNCYNSSFLFNCKECRDSNYLEDCIGCSNCFACVNLVGKQYCINNEQYSKDEYILKIQELQHNTTAKTDFITYKSQFPKKYSRILNSENCSGDQIENSKNCYKCFHAHDAEECRYGEHVFRNAKYCMDVSTAGGDAEKIYESINCGISDYSINFSVQVWSGCNYLNYCMNSYTISNCFGCVGLNNKEYCILNKQYSEEEYNKIVPKIINHMKTTPTNDGTGFEWGEFFPSNISPFGYNETVANEYFPLSKEEVLNPTVLTDIPLIKVGEINGIKLGGYFNWSNYELPLPDVEKIISASKLPDDINKIPDDILNWAIECEITNKAFRIIKSELEFYRKLNISIPRKHPDVRHLERMKLRNPSKLYDRKCDKCSISINTPYSKDKIEKIYCEECYGKEIY